MARLDFELVTRGLARSRQTAKEMVSSGAVTVNGRTVTKPSAEVSADDEIGSAAQEKYVGRGALKLERAVEVFGLELGGKICVDVGASTGGFTDLMLQNGAERVFAVDVGHGQLAQSLRNDERVICMEGTDIRTLTAEDIGGEADFVCADVSFVSLTHILPSVRGLMKDGASAAVLIKPQFEAGRSSIGKHGIVRDIKVHIRVLTELDSFFRSIGLMPVGYTYSPVKGGSGNTEYLVHLKKTDEAAPEHDFKKLAESAFSALS
ncbi:MAG: TlyA family RNA methyltransferase [Ruminococcus sp.]|nr:TlyA family RNA methyltransferase [Ruminococcus sp.]